MPAKSRSGFTLRESGGDRGPGLLLQQSDRMQDIHDVAETMRREYYGRAVNPEYCLDCGEPRAIGRCEG